MAYQSFEEFVKVLNDRLDYALMRTRYYGAQSQMEAALEIALLGYLPDEDDDSGAREACDKFIELSQRVFKQHLTELDRLR